MKPLQGFFNALLPVPAITRFNLGLKGVQIGAGSSLKVAPTQFGHISHPLCCSLEHGGVVRQIRLLRYIDNTQTLLNLPNAIISKSQAPKNAEQRRLSCTIAANQANAFIGFEGKICMIQQGDVPKRKLGIEKSNECHGAIIG